jgi:NAD(P)-dependent dehydrogenase (short-subunit alcohol dehydrogenase family)
MDELDTRSDTPDRFRESVRVNGSRMSHGMRLLDFIQLHAGTTLEAFARNVGSAFLLVEKARGSAETEKRFLTTMAPVGTGADLDTNDALVFAIVSSGEGPTVSLGRAKDSDIALDDPAVSKTHLCFAFDAPNGQHTVRDTGSQNGTKLNGVVLEQDRAYPIAAGDELEVAGRYRAIFVSAEALHARVERESSRSPAQDSPRPAGSRSTGLLAGKVCVITGAGRGVGRAYALRFAEEGCAIVVNDNGARPDGSGTDDTVATGVVSEIERSGGTAIASAHDVSVRAEVEALFQLAADRFGGVDILVCCAGALVIGPSVLELDDEVWERLMAVNTRGTFLCMQVAGRLMVEQKRPGRMITTSSILAMNGNPGLVAYSTSKAAIYGLTMTSAMELAPHGITVNSITPLAWTRLTNTIPAIAAIPGAEELFSPRYVADVALFLASELSATITGQIIDVGGPQLFLHRLQQTELKLPKEGRWTAQELQRRWPEITQS